MKQSEATDEKQNAKRFPQTFYARHMEAGLAGYENETILVSTDTIKKMMPSFNNMPIYVEHMTKECHLVDLERDGQGFVTETFYNELDGWCWSKILVTGEEAFDAIAKGWSVSNCYSPTEWGNGGMYHGCPYTREITNGEYSHLAIVDNPRYENACIMTQEEYKIYCDEKKNDLSELQNSIKQKKGLNIMFFKNKKEEVKVIDKDTMVEIQNDDGTITAVNVMEMAALVEKQNAAKEKEDEKEMANMDSMVDVGGKSMSIKELINEYESITATKNDMDVDDYTDRDKTKDNADDEDEDEDEVKVKVKEKDNSLEKKRFDELSNAHIKDQAPSNTPWMKMDGLKKGKAKY
ncbi:MAG: hypothetical protein COB09_18870 [Thalassobium sp.]|nr:MAG: hypothetical protein COB09_18870 [Thalassobium sp.]